MRLVISRPTEPIPDLILFFDHVQRQSDTYTSKHEDGPLPPKRVDGHAL